MGALDQLRTMYVKSPPWLRKAAAQFLQLLPPEMQYGKSYAKTREAIVRSRNDANFVQGWQAEKATELLRGAMNAPYYRELFGKRGITEPKATDLKRLPVLNKDIVRAHELTDFLAVPVSQLDLVSSSGSSGKPFSLYLDKDRSVREWAYINSVWAEIGYKPGHVRAVLRDMRADVSGKAEPWSYDPALRELKLSTVQLTPAEMNKYLEQLAVYKVNFIHGYPSAIFTLALHAERVGWKPPSSLLGILPISEVMFGEQRELISRVFGNVPIQAFYGLSEKVAFAGEVSKEIAGEQGVYEFEPLYGITEILDDDDQPVSVGQTGRLVSTGLLCKGMPMIRYDTGDRATLVQLPTAENNYCLRAKGIGSKWVQAYLVGLSGATIPLTALVTPKDEYGFIKDMQYYQDTPGIVKLRILPNDASVTVSRFDRIVRETAQNTRNDIKILVELVSEIPANSRGKRKFVEQSLLPETSESSVNA